MLSSALARGREVWSAFWSPEIPDERRAAREKWEALAPALKDKNQVLGRHSAGCSATYGVMEACNFKCTACYLADTANDTPPLPFEEVKVQLDRIREHLGPWGNTQITAGEVTLLPCDDLIRILKYCQEIQLSPMVMTHGQNILQEPNYLHRLMVEGGLDKISIHIDTTQKGRLGLRARDTEADIHWIRDAFANLVRQARRITGRPLAAATTMTVTEDNFHQIPDVMRWLIANNDAFRMVSFQPTAEVGRTRVKEQVEKQPELWDQICEGVGETLNRHAFKIGHPKCNTTTLMFVIEFEHNGEMERHVMEVTRPDVEDDQTFLESLLNDGFAGFSPDGEPNAVVLARILGRLRKHPKMAASIPAFCVRRAWDERSWIPRFLRAVSTGKRWRINPFVIIIHNFMSSHQLETKEGKERLEACFFRVPIDGEMVSMCELNGTDMRRKLNHDDQDRLITVVEPIRRAG